MPSELHLTDGALAMINLQAQIEGRERHAATGTASVSDRVELIELVALRGQILARISDCEWAEAMAKQLARDVPMDGESLVARARAHTRFHRFTDALADLDAALRLSTDRIVVEHERANVFLAVGRYEEAMAIYNDVAKRRRDFDIICALAVLHAELKQTDTAEQLFEESRERYRGVSPFPLAILDFQRGHMWMSVGDAPRARIWFESAIRLVPAYVPAHGHLAEVEAELARIRLVHGNTSVMMR